LDIIIDCQQPDQTVVFVSTAAGARALSAELKNFGCLGVLLQVKDYNHAHSSNDCQASLKNKALSAQYVVHTALDLNDL
jgi:hypothetical protein